MKFPGRRATKHYFPVAQKSRTQNDSLKLKDEHIYIVGLDQLLVDIEINVTDEFLATNNFPKGQSFLIDDELADKIYYEYKEKDLVVGEYPGGAIGNTLHNFSILSDAGSIALGSIKKDITMGDYAFKYLAKTSGLVDLDYLQPSQKPMGRALCFISEDQERTFAISKGCMNDLRPEYVNEEIIKNSAALLVSAYTIRSKEDPIYESTYKACKIAKQNNVPVVFSLGTSDLVKEKKEEFREFIRDYVTVLAMNQQEALELFDEEDTLLCVDKALELVDLALVTVGKKGLYLGSFVEDELKRKTKEPLVTKSIVNYNEFEYSRSMRKRDCQNPLKVYTHISPFKGGPIKIKNTNGAGDAALSAILHDIAANRYHKQTIPLSPKHEHSYLTYSSISQISKYANRVSYEVLIQNSPRLHKGLPQREDSLDDAYWRK
ncbi:MAG: inosine/guanosine kinase [Bacteriovoracaceae bacterium]|jgi:inosine kinase|nr:inosine/guanosine kinase [Bacteriovoracaceae bacterium]